MATGRAGTLPPALLHFSCEFCHYLALAVLLCLAEASTRRSDAMTQKEKLLTDRPQHHRPRQSPIDSWSVPDATSAKARPGVMMITHSYATLLGKQKSGEHQPNEPKVVSPVGLGSRRKLMAEMKGDENVTRMLRRFSNGIDQKLGFGVGDRSFRPVQVYQGAVQGALTRGDEHSVQQDVTKETATHTSTNAANAKVNSTITCAP